MTESELQFKVNMFYMAHCAVVVILYLFAYLRKSNDCIYYATILLALRIYTRPFDFEMTATEEEGRTSFVYLMINNVTIGFCFVFICIIHFKMN